MIAPELVAAAYPPAYWTHITLVSSSVALFALRGAGVLLGATWPLRRPWRRLSMVIDTALLAAGASLWTLLQFNPQHDTWLGTKLVLLVLYITLGTLALQRAPTRMAQAVCYVAALACVAFMVSIAIRHHPLGWWAP